MLNEVKLLPCEPYVLGPISECDDFSEDDGPLWQSEVQTHGGYGVAATIYAGTEDEARQMAEQAIAAWNTRPTTVVTDEVVERVAQALESADDAWFEIRPRDRVGTIWQSMARAALASMPTVVTGEQPQDLGGVEKVRHHLTEARHIMYDEHWLSEAIDRFLASAEPPAQPGDA